MKQHFSKLGLLLAFTFFAFSCAEDNVELKKDQYQIVDASSTERATVAGWLSTSASPTIAGKFNTAGLHKIVDSKNGVQILSILNTNNPSEALSLSLDELGQVKSSFLSKTTQGQHGVTSEIYSIDGVLQFSYLDKTDGTREILVSQSATNGRTEGWWSDADDCVGKFHSLTGSNIGDIAVGAVFNAATLGLYTPLSLVLCAGYATAKLAE